MKLGLTHALKWHIMYMNGIWSFQNFDNYRQMGSDRAQAHRKMTIKQFCFPRLFFRCCYNAHLQNLIYGQARAFFFNYDSRFQSQK
ncbi:hypothetical protein NIES4075_62630 [Tolypothrix sp. NIES-4075]|nr:hypothetical protein NIES4075_62630 [Tolypothrix sp. NIES-4075]